MTDAHQELTASDRAVKRFTVKFAGLFALKYALIILTFWGFIWGTLVIALRYTAEIPRTALLWGLAAVLPAVIAAIVLGLRKTPAAPAVRAFLDYQSGCGGLLMAAEQVDVGRWRERLEHVTAPRMRWRGGRTLAIFGLTAVFVIASFLIPARQRVFAADQMLDIGNEVEKLSEDAQLLKEEQIIDQTTAESLENELKQVGEQADADDPAKTWEALDHVESTFLKKANEAAEDALRKTERLTQTETLADALSKDGSKLSSQLATGAMKELSRMAKDSATENESFKNALSDELREALESGTLNSDQLKEIASKLKMTKAEIAQQLTRLREAGLIDPSKLKECDKLGKCDSAGLAAFLKENSEDDSVSDSVAAFCLSKLGKGGIDRGRGDAPMMWSDGSSEQGAKFKEQVLNPNALASLENSKLVGRSTGAPTVETSGPQHSGALKSAAPGGGSAFTHSVFPRHRGAVQRYFARQ